MLQALTGRKIKVETSLRCDFDSHIIEKGKYALQITGDPKDIKCQGIFHGSQCYNQALEDYNKKKKELDFQEEGNE